MRKLLGILKILALLVAVPSLAQEQTPRLMRGGAQSGGGGDEVVQTYRSYLHDLLVILGKNEATFSKLGVDLESIKNRVLPGPKQVTVYTCDRVPQDLKNELAQSQNIPDPCSLLVVNQVPKSAWSLPSHSLTLLSEDFLKRAASDEPIQRIRLVFHELLILESVEINDDYHVSEQLSQSMLIEAQEDLSIELYFENLKPEEFKNALKWEQITQPSVLSLESLNSTYEALDQTRSGQTVRVSASGTSTINNESQLIEAGLAAEVSETDGKKQWAVDFFGRLYLKSVRELLKQNGSTFVQFGVEDSNQFAQLAAILGFMKFHAFGSSYLSVKIAKAEDRLTSHLGGELVSLIFETKTKAIAFKNVRVSAKAKLELGQISGLSSSVESTDPAYDSLLPGFARQGVTDFFTHQLNAGKFRSDRYEVAIDLTRRIGFQIELMNRKLNYDVQATQVLPETINGNTVIHTPDLGILKIRSNSQRLGIGLRIRF